MNLRNAAAVCAGLGLAAATAAPASAGPYSDEMAKCLVKSTSNADRSSLVRWMFAVAARELFSDPSVAAGMSDLANYIDNAKMERVFGPARQEK